MRVLALLVSCLIAGQAAALGSRLYPDLMEFDAALGVYRAGEFDRARRAFTHLAELGDPEAQFNLGVMLLKGEGGDSDTIAGTAWVQWAAESGVAGTQDVLAIMAGRLDKEARVQVEAALAGLREAHALEPKTSHERAHPDGSRESCYARNWHRPPPAYPEKALRMQRVGFAVLHMLLSPEGNVDAVHAYPDSHRYGPFGPQARDTARQWNAHGCRAERYFHLTQNISFQIVDEDGRTVISHDQRSWIERTLTEARAGGAEQAYIVGMLGDLYDEFFAIGQDERYALLHRAAVAGFPDARYEYARALPSDRNQDRWQILAARQGFAPALFQLHSWDELTGDERQQGLFRAAEAGFLPAVLLAVRHLAAHPDAGERDGARALELSAGVHDRIRRGDASMAEAHAMALAETGRLDDAVTWQRRALSTGRRLGRETRGAAERLARYEAGEPWRDPLLSFSPDAEDDD